MSIGAGSVLRADDEQVTAVVVADIVEHGADDAHSYKVYDPLWELSDIGGVSLKQPLELFGPSGTFVHDAITSACATARLERRVRTV